MKMPADWPAEKIIEFTNSFNLMLAGDLAQRAKIVAVPGGDGDVQFMQQLTFDAQFDEWLARIICHRFGVSPTPFVRMNNRATAETIEESSTEKSIVPLMQHFKSVFDSLIEHQCGKPHLEFVWTTQQLHYRMEDASINSTLLHDGVITLDHVRKMRGLPPLPDGLGKDPMVWTGSGPMLLRDVKNGLNQQQPPMGMLSTEASQPLALPQLSLTGEQEADDDTELPELSLKAELSAWETYALKRLGKMNTRPFECKAVPETLAAEIQTGLKHAADPRAVKAVFEQARRNLGRKRTPSVEGSLDHLMTEYEDLIKTAVEKAKNAFGGAMKSWDESEHPRDNDGKFASGNGGGSGTMGDNMPSQSEYAKDKTTAAFKARADKINSYSDRDSEVHDAERQQLLDDMIAAGYTPQTKALGDVIANLSVTGGFTYDISAGEVKTVGFAVSIEGHEKLVNIDGMDDDRRRDEFDRYIEDNLFALSEPDNHFGGWVSPEGVLVLDVSKVTNDIKEARRNAVNAGQEAFYDFQTGSDVVIRKGAVQERNKQFE